MEKVTINDIARQVGVSKATISYYLNGNTHKMSLKTSERIRQVIEETGYQPNKVAQSLVTRDTKTIGVVIADITNPFISTVMKAVHDTCTIYGYTVNFTNSDNDPLIEEENIHRLEQQHVSGMIIDPTDANRPFLQELDNTRVVMVDREAKNLVLDTVVSNNIASTKAFLEKMKVAGYEDIYFVSFPLAGISTREKRYQGFKEVVSDNPEKLLILGEEGIEDRILDLIAQKTEKLAFFTMNGPTLLAFMKIVNNSPYSYPRDFGLGSYEDLEWMEVLSPKVSCIRQESYQIGELAARHLIQKLKDEIPINPPQLLVVPSLVVLRDSF
ncbi:LacI family DNA-binding transcriptional regulator [Streptococcus sciuri]|uniref:LacI family DNA-binding transcriptional regulator n=1 Tax=Streptococcus sciuri TaxID=2973939 RepID=A0ABT2F6E2_9STRE|nr:LacI family DNA-binding transcriptional regulator [Streptococcus sciuri]MCS4488004.1 LacI family DNA-binding transcriptional regulator [Streptococcus sciuri]